MALSFRFLDRLANVAGLIQNLRIAEGDRVDVAFGKLQGQLDRIDNRQRVVLAPASATPGVFVVPPGVYRLWFRLQGPGGNGGELRTIQMPSEARHGPGGSSGAYIEGLLAVTPGQEIAYRLPGTATGSNPPSAWLVAASGSSSIVAGAGNAPTNATASSTNGTIEYYRPGVRGSPVLGSDYNASEFLLVQGSFGDYGDVVSNPALSAHNARGGRGADSVLGIGGAGGIDHYDSTVIRRGFDASGFGAGGGGCGGDGGSLSGVSLVSRGSPSALILEYVPRA